MIAKLLGQYRIESALGAGGMGEVYLARDTMLGRLVALKVIHSAELDNPDRVRRFVEEARAAPGSERASPELVSSTTCHNS